MSVMEELSVRATAISSNTKERVGEQPWYACSIRSRQSSLRAIPLTVHEKCALYKYFTLKCAIHYLKFDDMTAFQVRVRDWL